MPILHSPDSGYAKEMTKWEAQGSALGPGLRPYVKHDYPMMIHLAGRPAGGLGGDTIIDSVVVEQHDATKWAQGYRPTPTEALEYFTAQQMEFSKLAAEREYEVKHKLSVKAVQEVRAAEAEAGAVHLPTIPEQPKRKYVRKVKPEVN